MDNNDTVKVRKGWPVYLVFFFLIAVLGYVIYAQRQASKDQMPMPQEGENAIHVHDSGVNASNSDSDTTGYTLAQIINAQKNSYNRTWDPVQTEIFGQKAPEFTVKGLDGSDIKLSDFAGKEVVVVFWATWCPYCIKEIPHLNVLQEDMKDDVVVLGISDESASVVKDFVADRKINYKLAIASYAYRSMGDLYAKVPSVGRPTSLHIGKDGKIKVAYVGSPSVTELKRIVKSTR